MAPTFGGWGAWRGTGPLARPTSEAGDRPAESETKLAAPPFLAVWQIRAWEPTIPGMGFNRRKLEDQRREAAEKEAIRRTSSV